MIMEVCIDSVQSAINAEKAGADRVELCSNLTEGGTTPPLGLLQVIKEKTLIPVFVMVRPRGGDFLYTDLEFEVMRREIEIFKENGADGFVLGVLTEDGSVDVERSAELVALCKPYPVTFHRAFDMCSDGDKALEDVIKTGCTRILTSGLEPTVLEGLPNLKRFVEKAGDRIIIVPGGGINERNIQRIIDGCYAKEFHWSARTSRKSDMNYQKTDLHMGAALYPSEFATKFSDVERIAAIKNIF